MGQLNWFWLTLKKVLNYKNHVHRKRFNPDSFRIRSSDNDKFLNNNKKAFDGNDIENGKSTEDANNKKEINLPTPSKFPKFVDDVAVQDFFQRIADDFSSQLDGYSVQYSDNDESTVSPHIVWLNLMLSSYQ